MKNSQPEHYEIQSKPELWPDKYWQHRLNTSTTDFQEAMDKFRSILSADREYEQSNDYRLIKVQPDGKSQEAVRILAPDVAKIERYIEQQPERERTRTR